MLKITRFMNKQPSIPFKPNNKMVKCLWLNATDTKQIKVSNGRKFKLSNALNVVYLRDCFASKYLIIFSHLFVFTIPLERTKRDERQNLLFEALKKPDDTTLSADQVSRRCLPIDGNFSPILCLQEINKSRQCK